MKPEGLLSDSFASVVTMESRTDITDQFYGLLTSKSLQGFDALLSRNAPLRQVVLESKEKPLQNRLPQAQYKRNVLYAGHHFLSDLFSCETGLFDFSPPESVHAMVRDVAYCGDLYYADLVAEAATLAGLDLRRCTSLLDFGCSSGRVLMPLATSPLLDACQCYGCDPIESAITWAQANIRNAQISLMNEDPPLGYSNNQFELVYAISIWSHFSLERAEAWLKELHRIIKPNGLAILTTHGLGSLNYFDESKAMNKQDTLDCQEALQKQGHCFFDVYQQQKDWGLQNPGWGLSFFHPLFFIQLALKEGFCLKGFWPRRAEGNQDVFALQRL